MQVFSGHGCFREFHEIEKEMIRSYHCDVVVNTALYLSGMHCLGKRRALKDTLDVGDLSFPIVIGKMRGKDEY